MDWRKFIHSDPRLHDGKPVIRGTKLEVEFILDLISSGWTHQQILDDYPILTPEALVAVQAFFAEAR